MAILAKKRLGSSLKELQDFWEIRDCAVQGVKSWIRSL